MTAASEAQDSGTRVVRLSVNLAPDVSEALRHLCAIRDMSITEGVRRAIAIWNFLEAEKAKGHTLASIDDSDRIRELVLL